MKKAVIFDLDGTILYTLPDLANATNYALVELGLPQRTFEEIRSFIGHGKKYQIEKALPDTAKGMLDIALKYYDPYYGANCMKDTSKYPGMHELLQKCHDLGIKLCVLTNKPDIYTQKMIPHYYPGLFDIVRGGNDRYPLKPDPSQLNSIVEELGFKKEEILYVGDSDTDVLTANNGGLDCCGVLWGYRDRENLEMNKPKYIAETMDELMEVICQ